MLMSYLKPKSILVKCFVAALALTSYSCSSNSGNNTGIEADTLEQKTSYTVNVNQVLNSVPAPIEMANLIKASQAEFSSEWLNPSEKNSDYNSQFKMALNLGVYGADLAYINLYQQTERCVAYIANIRTLSEQLGVAQFFDFKKLKQLAEEKENLDSILILTTRGFDKMNHYLLEIDQPKISWLILTGGWVEALSISCNVIQRNQGDSAQLSLLQDHIAEQKIVLNTLLMLGEEFKSSDPFVPELLVDLQKLKNHYNNIEMNYNFVEPQTHDTLNKLIVTDKSEYSIQQQEESFDLIAQQTEELRKKITL